MNVRIASARDASAIAEIYAPYVTATHISFEEAPPDAEEMATRIEHPLYPWLIITVGDQVAGYASTTPMRARAAYRWSVETGVYLRSGCHGRGLGSALLSAHLDLLERQGFVTALAGISLPNAASVALHERLGFALSGIERAVGFKGAKWIDVGRWQRDLAPRLAQPAEPRPFAGLLP